MIIDAWGRDRIYTIDERKHINSHDYTHTIFISGDYLSKIVDEIDAVPWVRWSYATRRDMYSEKKVLEIRLPPSKIEEMIMAVEKIGNYRDYQIYNADINIVQSFMVENKLNFFNDDTDGFRRDFSIPDLNILNVKFWGSIEEIEIDGELFSDIDASLDYFFSHIEDANMVISDGGDTFFQELFKMARRKGYSIKTGRSRERVFTSYGRIQHRKSGFIISGVPHVDAETSFMFNEGGLEGVVTISSMTSLPLFNASRITPGTAVSSYEVRRALERGIMIPLYKGDHETMKSMDQFVQADRGGLYLQPVPGIYENVYEIDFSSMYPSIIVNYNLSPETVNGKCNKFETIQFLGYNICNDRKGLLSDFLSELLDIRLYYKSMKRMDERYAMRDRVLKWLLLTSFGYTGYKNAKFGKIEVHEAITAIGRNILAESYRIAQEEGFDVIHGIVDSLWLQGNGDIKRVMRRIEDFSRLKISLEGHYNWIAFLPSSEGDGALNRYFGLMDDGSFKIRGIELRRSDFPLVCKKMQQEVIDLYANVSSVEGFRKIYSRASGIYESYKESVIAGRVNDDDLRVSFVMTRYPEYYKVRGLRKKAAELSRDKKPGDKISIFVTNEKKGNVSIDNLEYRYDKNFYLRKLALAWESVSFPLRETGGINQKSIEEYGR